MKGILKVLALALFLPPAHDAQAQAESYEGIWQGTNAQASYFLLRVAGNKVVLVDLASLELTRKTLASSYRGELETSRSGDPIATVRVITVDPDSQGSGTISANPDETLNISWCHLQSGGCLAGFRSTLKKVLTPYDAQAQSPWYEGVWEQEGSPGIYYSLLVEGDEVVLVDLASLERTGQTLAAAYRGKWSAGDAGAPIASLRAIARHPGVPDRLDIAVLADKTLQLSWCSTSNDCAIGVYTTLRKVF